MTKRLIAAYIVIAALAVASSAFSREPTLSSGNKNASNSFDSVLDENFSLYYIPDVSDGPIMTNLSQNEPPLLKSHTMYPEKPGPDDAIEVAAEIFNDPAMTMSKTIEADLYYSIDEKNTWNKIEMDNDKKDNRAWTATIPPTGKTGALYYFFTAMDNAENYFMELPVVDVEWASKNGEGFYLDISDGNDPSSIVPDDLDLLSASLAYDGEKIYITMAVEGEISGGTVTPFEVNIYSAGFYIPSERREIGPKPRYVLVHSQHAQFITFPIIGLLDVEKRLAEVAAADPRYYSTRNRLYMRMEKIALDKQKHSYVMMAIGTAIGTNPLPLVVEPKDVSGFINVVLGEHSMEIE